MATISQYLNKLFSGSPSKPLMTGDVMKGSDYSRDFWWLMDRVGSLFYDVMAANASVLISGGVVTQGADVTHVNITAAIGYVPFTVTVGVDALSPPTIGSEDVTALRVSMGAQSALALTGVSTSTVITNATLNGSAVNYVKLQYAEADGLTRTRLKAPGSWAFTKAPSYLLTIDTTAPTAYQFVIATLVGNGSSTLTITQYYPPWWKQKPAATYLALSSGTPYTLQSWQAGTIDVTTGASAYVLNLPAASIGMSARIRKVDSGAGKVQIAPNGTDTINGITGAASWEITDQWGYVDLQAITGGWAVVANEGTIYRNVITSTQTQASPVGSTWYNLGGSLTLGPGTYDLSWRATLYGAGSTLVVSATLSTANNSESDVDFSAQDNTAGGAVSGRKIVRLATSTTFYLNAATTGSLTSLSFQAGVFEGNTIIEARRIA